MITESNEIKIYNHTNICPGRTYVPYVIGFFDNCHGIILSERREGDKHICIAIVTEDDGQWFFSSNGLGSSYWINEIKSLIDYAIEWMNKNADTDGKYGWRFK